MATRILFITDAIYPGGSYTYLSSFIKEICKHNNVSIDLITFGDCPIPVEQNVINNFNYYHFTFPRKYSLISIFRRIIKLLNYFFKNHSKYDLLITDLANVSFCVLISKYFFSDLRRIPHLYQFHGSVLLEKKSMGKFNNKLFGCLKYRVNYYFENFVIRQVSKVIVFSKYSKELIEKLHHIHKKIIFIKPGITHYLNSKCRNMSKFQARSYLGFNHSTPIFLLVSRIEKRKGVDQFIKNFSKYYKNKGQLVLCSNFDQVYFNIFPILEEANLGSKIKLINSPSPDQLSMLYRAATVTILPSTTLETFGFVTYESLYFYTPVIAFDIGANPELIEAKYLTKYGLKNRWQKLVSQINDIEKKPIEKYCPPLIDSFSWSPYLKKILTLVK